MAAGGWRSGNVLEGSQYSRQTVYVYIARNKRSGRLLQNINRNTQGLQQSPRRLVQMPCSKRCLTQLFKNVVCQTCPESASIGLGFAQDRCRKARSALASLGSATALLGIGFAWLGSALASLGLASASLGKASASLGFGFGFGFCIGMARRRLRSASASLGSGFARHRLRLASTSTTKWREREGKRKRELGMVPGGHMARRRWEGWGRE